jgi:hypothetical protein
VQAVYFAIVAAYVVAQERVSPILDRIFERIRAHLRPIAIGLFLTLGVVFMAKGLISLAS